MQDVEELKKKAVHFKSLGVHGIMKNKDERTAFIQFHADINSPIKRTGCSSCYMQAFFIMETKLNNFIQQNNFDMAEKQSVTYKMRSDIPNVRAWDGNVYNKNTLTQEVAKGIVERYPDTWHNFLMIDATESKPKRRVKKEQPPKDSE